MKVITLNCNGLRSAKSKGLFAWLNKEQADIICLQEIRIQEDTLQEYDFELKSYLAYYHFAQKKGYSGVAVYSRVKPKKVHFGLAHSVINEEGRYLQLDFSKCAVASLYLPSGSSSEERQTIKYQVMDFIGPWMQQTQRGKKEFLICGDWNIAHKEIDIKNWKGNLKNSGFLPEERAWLSQVLGEWGWFDVFRNLNSQAEQYTWWSNRGQAWSKNVGWRIDYQIATSVMAQSARSERIYKDERFSDHAPLIIEYDFDL